MLAELKKLIEANPLFRDKLQFPPLKNSRLRTLINQRSLTNSRLPFVSKPNSRAIFSVIDIFYISSHRCVELQFKLAASTL